MYENLFSKSVDNIGDRVYIVINETAEGSMSKDIEKDLRSDFSPYSFQTACFARRSHIKREEGSPSLDVSALSMEEALDKMMQKGWGVCRDKGKTAYFCPWCWARVRANGRGDLIRTAQGKIKWFLAWEEMNEPQRVAELRRKMREGDDLLNHDPKRNVGGRPVKTSGEEYE